MKQQVKNYALSLFWDCPDESDFEEMTYTIIQRVLIVLVAVCGLALMIHNVPWAFVALMAIVTVLGVLYAD